jgi:hypothetical protein
MMKHTRNFSCVFKRILVKIWVWLVVQAVTGCGFHVSDFGLGNRKDGLKDGSDRKAGPEKEG